MLDSAQLRVHRARLGFASDSYPAIDEACSGTVLWLERGAVDVQALDFNDRLNAEVGLWVPGNKRLDVLDGEGTYFVGRANADTDECVDADRVRVIRNPQWHDNAGGKLKVRVYFGGQGDDRMSTSLAELRGEAGFSVPPHVHEDSDENLWIKQGAGTMRVGDEIIDVRGEQWIHIPKGVLHSFESDGSEPLVALQMYVPSGPEQRFIKE